MKKINLCLVGAIMVFGMSCALEESKFETVINEGTIEGKVELDDDLTDGEALYTGASNVTVVITYDSDDLSYTGSTGVSVTKQIVVTTDASGSFTAQVPAIANDVTYSIKIFKFLGTYRGFDEDGDESTLTGYFPEYNTSVSLVEGETEYIKIQLGTPTEF